MNSRKTTESGGEDPPAFWGLRTRWRRWRLKRARRRRDAARRERIRVEERYGEMDTIPPVQFTYEMLRHVAFIIKLKLWP